MGDETEPARADTGSGTPEGKKGGRAGKVYLRRAGQRRMQRLFRAGIGMAFGSSMQALVDHGAEMQA